MKAAIHAVERPGDGGAIDDGIDDHLRAFRCVGALARRQIVDDPHLVAVGDQRVREMGPDEAATARNQIIRHGDLVRPIDREVACRRPAV